MNTAQGLPTMGWKVAIGHRRKLNREDHSAHFPKYYLGYHKENEIDKACICTLHGKCEKYLIGREERKEEKKKIQGTKKEKLCQVNSTET
jgi:hypothetical protein